MHINDHWIKLRHTLEIEINSQTVNLLGVHEGLQQFTAGARSCLQGNSSFRDSSNLCSACFSCVVKTGNEGLTVKAGGTFKGSVLGAKPLFAYSSSFGGGDPQFVSDAVSVAIDTEDRPYGDSEMKFLTDLLGNDARFLLEAPLSCLGIDHNSRHDKGLRSKLSSVVAVVLHIHTIQAPCGLCSALLVGLAKALATQDHSLKKSLENKAATYFGNDKCRESQPIGNFFKRLGSEIPFLICISSDYHDGNCAFWAAADECTLAQFNGRITPVEIKSFVPNVLWYSFEPASPAKLGILASMLNDRKAAMELNRQCEEQELRIQDLISQVEALQTPVGKSSVRLEVSDAVVIENIPTQEVSDQAGMPSDLEAEVAAPSTDEVSESMNLSADRGTENVGLEASSGSENAVDDDNRRSPRSNSGVETESEEEEEESCGESSVEREDENEEPGSGKKGCLVH